MEPKVGVEPTHFINYSPAPGEILLTCPYDNHSVLQKKLKNHLVRCRRNYLKKCQLKDELPQSMKCRWNSQHLVLDVELPFHEKNCSSRQTSSEDQDAWKELVPKNRDQPKLPEDGEIWDDDDANDGYDPTHKIKNECIFFMPSGLPRAERKQWRQMKRDKFSTSASSPLGGIENEPTPVDPSTLNSGQGPIPVEPSAAVVDDGPSVYVHNVEDFYYEESDSDEEEEIIQDKVKG